MEPDAQQLETRQRLLAAAGEVFAEQGFRKATVRDICQRANANVAAVNYHFGDKMGLYRAVLRDSYASAYHRFPPTLGLGPNPTPEQRLHAFVRAFLLRIFDQGRSAWLPKVISREMYDPTPALDHVVEEAIRPQFLLLAAIVRDLLGRGEIDDDVRRAACSVVGQCLFYHHARAVVSRLGSDPNAAAGGIEGLADHITRFSLAGIRALQAEAGGATP